MRSQFEDDDTLAFRDINPTAPTHVVLIPKKRDGLTSLTNAKEHHERILGRLMLAAREVAVREGIADSGYRLVVNAGPHGGQTVDHLHLHVIGGKQLTWPPGTGDAEGIKEG